jgi:hydroxymethylbilane synthase
VDVELVPVSTRGDQLLTPVGAIGGQGLFTKELERELSAGRIDLAVHSLKDLPTDTAPGLCLAAIPPRAPVADVLIATNYARFEELPPAAEVGTGSLRRRAQLLHLRPDLQIRDIRGNVDTRLRKLHAGEFAAIILAQAGLERLGLTGQITQQLPLSVVLPAAGQGALALETRSDDGPTRELLQSLDDAATRVAVTAERAMLAALQGGCLAPVAAWARLEDGQLVLSGRVLSPDGSRQLDAAGQAAPDEAAQLGQRVAQALLAQGAAELIASSRS